MNTSLRLSLLVVLAGNLMLATLLWIGQAAPVQADGITVTSAADTQANDGQCTLREAIINANNNNQSGSADCSSGGGSADTITFASDYTITLNSALPALSSTLKIDETIQQVTVSGNKAVRIFRIHGGSVVTISGLSIISGAVQNTSGGGILVEAGARLSLLNVLLADNASTHSGGAIATTAGSSLTISDSTLLSNSAVGFGGGIDNSGVLTLTNSTLSGNSVILDGGAIFNSFNTLTMNHSTLSGNSAGRGGGIHNSYGTSILSQSTLLNNSATEDGGSIYNSLTSTLTLRQSTLSNNRAQYGAGLFNDGSVLLDKSTLSNNSADKIGGGLYNYWNGTLTVSHSTLSNNTAVLAGGGLFNQNRLTAINSTLSNNEVEGDGGGIYNYGTLVITNSTLSRNSAEISAGGLYNNGTLHFSNSLIANSRSADCVNANPGGSIVTNISNWVEDNNCSSGAFNFHSGDPALGPLQDNGGPTFTHALLLNSPAANTGSNAIAIGLSFDQRGPNFPRILQGIIDIGAFESEFGNPFYMPLVLRE